MSEDRKGFVFLQSYYQAIRRQPQKVRLKLYDALLDYAFTGRWPEREEDTVLSILTLIRPNLDSSIRRYSRAKENGRKGGNPAFRSGTRNPYYEKQEEKDNLKDNPKDNPKDNLRDNPKDNLESDKDKETESDKEREKDKETESRSCFGPYGNVFLSSGEVGKLQKLYPNTWQQEVDRLSRHLEEGRPLPTPNHCDAITALFTERTLAGLTQPDSLWA